MEQNFMDGGWGCGEGWGLGVRVLHFSQLRDEKSAFFQLEVRGLPLIFTILFGFPRKILNFGVVASAARRRTKIPKLKNLGGTPNKIVKI